MPSGGLTLEQIALRAACAGLTEAMIAIRDWANVMQADCKNPQLEQATMALVGKLGFVAREVEHATKPLRSAFIPAVSSVEEK